MRPLTKNETFALKVFAICILLISYYVIVEPYWKDVQSTSDRISIELDELTKSPESNDFKLPMYFNFNESNPIGKINETDFAFILHLTYPNGSLIANDIIYVNATAVIDRIVESLDKITLAFPNSLRYPLTYGENRLPIQGILVFDNPIRIEGKINGTFTNIYASSDMNITFPVEGEYRPIIGLEFKDNSTVYFEAKNTILHVYPEEQLKQLETNRVSLESNLASLELSKAVFILSTIAIVSIAVQIFSYNNDNCKYQPNKEKEQAKIIETLRQKIKCLKKKSLTNKRKRKS